MPEARLRINLAAATVQGVPRPPGAEHPDAIIMSTTEAQLSQHFSLSTQSEEDRREASAEGATKAEVRRRLPTSPNP